MTIITQFNLGQRVKHRDSPDIGTVTGIDIEVESDAAKPTITYSLFHAAQDNLHVNANFGGSAYEEELEAA